jgi:hypothetical protein
MAVAAQLPALAGWEYGWSFNGGLLKFLSHEIELVVGYTLRPLQILHLLPQRVHF